MPSLLIPGELFFFLLQIPILSFFSFSVLLVPLVLLVLQGFAKWSLFGLAWTIPIYIWSILMSLCKQMSKSPWARVTAAVAAVIRLILATPKAQKSLCKPALCMMFLFLMSDLMCSGFCYEALDSESSALSSALLAKEEEESNIFFPFAYNCEWKAHIFFVHRSMHWKAVHLWTQVHQTETFFIILFSNVVGETACTPATAA